MEELFSMQWSVAPTNWEKMAIYRSDPEAPGVLTDVLDSESTGSWRYLGGCVGAEADSVDWRLLGFK